ncbi:MAG: hypothetical protein GY823_07285 [Flavobacteriaceae bacterium]|nr:hypothetical protein [Flavobacteriaceae bacterium]
MKLKLDLLILKELTQYSNIIKVDDRFTYKSIIGQSINIQTPRFYKTVLQQRKQSSQPIVNTKKNSNKKHSLFEPVKLNDRFQNAKKRNSSQFETTFRIK